MPRIAFKANGSILLLDLADILAVQAEGNYVSLRPRTNPHLVHASLSSMAEKLKPYGFIRIHRSVVVNISAVEEIQPLTDRRVQAACKRWEAILGNAYIQTQSQRSGSTVGRLRAALRLTGSKKFYVVIPRSIPQSLSFLANHPADQQIYDVCEGPNEQNTNDKICWYLEHIGPN
jgi:hypothetical protein